MKQVFRYLVQLIVVFKVLSCLPLSNLENGVELAIGTALGGDGDFSRNEVLGLGVGDDADDDLITSVLNDDEDADLIASVLNDNDEGDLIGSVLIRNFSSLKFVTAVGLVFTVFEMVVENILLIFE